MSHYAEGAAELGRDQSRRAARVIHRGQLSGWANTDSTGVATVTIPANHLTAGTLTVYCWYQGDSSYDCAEGTPIVRQAAPLGYIIEAQQVRQLEQKIMPSSSGMTRMVAVTCPTPTQANLTIDARCVTVLARQRRSDHHGDVHRERWRRPGLHPDGDGQVEQLHADDRWLQRGTVQDEGRGYPDPSVREGHLGRKLGKRRDREQGRRSLAALFGVLGRCLTS